MDVYIQTQIFAIDIDMRLVDKFNIETSEVKGLTVCSLHRWKELSHFMELHTKAKVMLLLQYT